MLRVGQHDGPAHIALGKCGTDICLVIRHFQLLHQISLDQLVLNVAQLQHHAAGIDGGKELVRVLCEKQDHHILRRLLDGLQKGVLSLYRHKIRLRDDIHLVGSLVRLHRNRLIHLFPDIVHAYAPRLLVGHPDDVRMVPALSLNAGMTFPAGLRPLLLTQERLREKRRQKLLPRASFPI